MDTQRSPPRHPSARLWWLARVWRSAGGPSSTRWVGALAVAVHDLVDLRLLKLDPERPQAPNRLAQRLARKSGVLCAVPDTDRSHGAGSAINALIVVLQSRQPAHRRPHLAGDGHDLIGACRIEAGTGETEIHRRPPCRTSAWDTPLDVAFSQGTLGATTAPAQWPLTISKAP